MGEAVNPVMGAKQTYFSVAWQDQSPATTNSGGKNNLCYEFSDLNTPTIFNSQWCKGGCTAANTGGVKWSDFATDRNGVKYYQAPGITSAAQIPASSQFGLNSRCFKPYH